MQKVNNYIFFNLCCMSKRLYSGLKYFFIGLVGLIVLLNFVDILESASIDCTNGPVSCTGLIDVLIYVAVFLILVGSIKLILFFWKEYKLIEKINEFKKNYEGVKKEIVNKEKEKKEGECYMCGTINDSDAVYCKKCATSLKEDKSESHE